MKSWESRNNSQGSADGWDQLQREGLARDLRSGGRGSHLRILEVSRLRNAKGSWQSPEALFPRGFWENMALPTAWFQISSLRNCRRICCFKATQSVVTRYISPRKQIHLPLDSSILPSASTARVFWSKPLTSSIASQHQVSAGSFSLRAKLTPAGLTAQQLRGLFLCSKVSGFVNISWTEPPDPIIPSEGAFCEKHRKTQGSGF